MSDPIGTLAEDAMGKVSQIATVRKWSKKRFTATATDWQKIDMGDIGPYTSVLMQNTGANDIILSESNSTVASANSNDPADAGYGVELKAGTEKSWMFTDNVAIYFRVKVGGAPTKLTVAVGL